jgi:phage repressor protein C with HTH and peptisase S24 domain
VIVDKSKITPKNGDHVVVVNDEVANIKRFYYDPENQMIILRSESTLDYSPIFIDPQEQWNGLVNGTVIQVIKNPGAVAV